MNDTGPKDSRARANQPLQRPREMETSNLSPAEVTRYNRQITLKGWGREAQERLKSSRVLIAGAGGLGCAAALYLMAGGVGAIRLADQARVNLADLGHQVLYREQDLGKPKATAAGRWLKELNSFVLVESLVKALSPHNVMRLAYGCQTLIDATNDAAAGLVLNQAAVKLRLPLVHACLWDMEGQVTTFWPGHGPCLACSFPPATRAGSLSLLSPLAGILGALQALEALRLLGGLGAALVGRILGVDGNSCRFTEGILKPNPVCPSCQAPGQMSQEAKDLPKIIESG